MSPPASSTLTHSPRDHDQNHHDNQDKEPGPGAEPKKRMTLFGIRPRDPNRDALLIPRQHRAALIVLPDDFDFLWWLEACETSSEEAAYLVEKQHGKVLLPGERMRTEVTYPHLAQVRDVRWVYLAWRAYTRVRQAASSVSVMKEEYLTPDMLPEYRAAFRVGIPYQYCFAEWERVPQLIVPHLDRMPHRWAHRIVHLATTDPTEFPL